MAKATKKQFIKIITTSRNWPHALERLHKHYGYSLKSDKAMRVRAKKYGVKPGIQHDIEIPDDYDIKGVSVLHKGDTELLRWTKTSKSAQRQGELIKEFAEGLANSLRGKSTFIPELPPDILDAELLTCYVEPEPHYGMHSWATETRENYDMKIANQILKQSASRLIAAAPNSYYALVEGLGDALHADNQTNETKSGNKLDVDSRWSKIVREYADFYRWWIEELLKKHQFVMVKRVKGNHDDHTTTAINLMLAFMFENNDRVVIDQGETMIKYHLFGKVLLGITHGHASKGDKLPLLMAADMPFEWGSTIHRYFHTGHIHHLSTKEYVGCVVESFRSVAAKDAWHADSGYRAGREMVMIVYNMHHGETERHTVGLSQLTIEDA